MSGIGLTPPLQVLGIGIANVGLLLVVLTGGLVGMSIRNMFDSILSEDDTRGVDANDADVQASNGEEGMADGGLMAEGDGDDLGDFGGLGDGDDLGEDDDAFGDEFGDMDEGGAGTDELEHRLDELENEVGSLSSTVNTVRTENEQISETVEGVEENVRKLLDIYEMVTRGVNPFADDIEAGMGQDGSFGLFDEDGDGGSGGGGEDGLDDDIAEADAEGFFDEDLVDDGDDDFDVDDGDFEDGDDVFDEGDGDDTLEDDFDDDFPEESDDGSDDGGEGGKSFQELKDEYDSGDAEWADGEKPDDLEEDTDDLEDDADDDLADDELFDEVIEDDESTAAAEVETKAPESDSTDATEPTAESGATEANEPTAAADTTAAATDESRATGAGKPYLATLPGGFAGDLVVVEWLEFLTERSSYRATDDAIDYYERIDWISPGVADELREYLRGFDSVDGDGGALTIDDHTQSLQYISQLDEGSAGVALSKLAGGGGGNGLFG